MLNLNGTKICQKQIHYGDDCREHNDCSQYNQEETMRCVQMKCECLNGYELFDSVGKTCVKIISGAAQKGASFVLIVMSLFAVLNVMP